MPLLTVSLSLGQVGGHVHVPSPGLPRTLVNNVPVEVEMWQMAQIRGLPNSTGDADGSATLGVFLMS